MSHNFNLIRAAELLLSEDLQPSYLWEGVLPDGGLSLLVAKPKVGKTTFSLNLAVAVSQGSDFLDRRTSRGPVVYLALEERKAEVKQMLSHFGLNDADLFFHFGPAPREAVYELRALIEERRCSLIVVDVLQKFLKTNDLNNYSEVSTLLEPIMALARRKNCHILLTHHAGKKERPDGDDILGSTGLLGGVDTSLHLKKRGESRSFFTIQRYGTAVPETVISLNRGQLEVVGNREQLDLHEVSNLILIALGNGPLTEREVWDQVPRGHSLTARALRILVESGRVRRSGTGTRGEPYVYSIFLSSLYSVESRRETFIGSNSLINNGLSSPDSFSKNDASQERNGEKKFELFGLSGEGQKPESEASPLPYLKNGDLVIPFDSDKRFYWWTGGQSIEETLKEVKESHIE